MPFLYAVGTVSLTFNVIHAIFICSRYCIVNFQCNSCQFHSSKEYNFEVRDKCAKGQWYLKKQILVSI